MQYNITYREKDKGIQFIISYKNNEGIWKQKSRQGFKTKKEAKLAADKELEKLKNNLLLESNLNNEYKDITFKKYVDMFCNHQKLYKEANTIRSYLTAFSKFKDLNNVLMSDIKVLDVQKCIDKLVVNDVNISSVKIFLSKIKLLFNTASEQGVISPIQLNNIKLPKDKNKKEKTALSQEELNDMLNKIENRNYYIISLIASKAGLRLGEILALKWSDIDIEKSQINVNKQFKYIDYKKMGIGSLKSKNSQRIVPISSKTLTELKLFKSEYPININNSLFQYKSLEYISYKLSKYYKKVGYNISVHELRHTYATNLVAQGLDFKTIARILGHDVEQTIRIYSHVTDDMIKKATKIINENF